jgi:glycosyltransferase involved in cell wall biosynthesis
MRILQIHNFYRLSGGEDIVLANEEKLLTRRGHEVWQYSLHNDSIPDLPQVQVAAQTLWNGNAYRAARQRIQKHGVELVHVHNTWPLVSPAVYYAAHAENVPVVQTLHNFRMICPASTFFRDGGPCEECLGKRFAWPAIVHRCYRDSVPASGMAALMLAAHHAMGTYSSKVDAYIAFNKFSLEKFVSGGLPRERIRIKTNFVLDDPGIGSGSGGYALFVGRLTPEKGVETLLKAWGSVSNSIILKIAGQGPLQADVEAFAKTRLNVEYLGQCPRARINELMRNAALLVFPSEWYEGSPMVILEAMASGTPILSSDRGSMAETIVPQENGFLFPAGSAAALASSVEKVFARRDYLSEMRYSTRQYYEAHFTAASNYKVLLSIYEGLVRRNSVNMVGSKAI